MHQHDKDDLVRRLPVQALALGFKSQMEWIGSAVVLACATVYDPRRLQIFEKSTGRQFYYNTEIGQSEQT